MSSRPELARPAVAPTDSATPPNAVQRRPEFRGWTLWRRELLRLAVVATIGALVGVWFDAPVAGVAVVLVLVLLVQIRHLIQLRIWLQHPKRYDLPEPGGLWGEAFDALLDLQRKNRKKKKKLAAILAQFQASTAALPDGAVVLGPRGEISWFNTAARTLLGLRVPQDIGIRVPNLIRHPIFTDYFEKAHFEGEVEVPSPVNNSKTLLLRVIPYGNNQRLLIARDVSERQMLEVARRDFVANASHELRTPLTVLRGYLDMMEMDAQGNGVLSPWAAPLSEMRNQALRMESLVNDMLKLARLEAGRAQARDEKLDPPGLIRRTVEEARTLSKGQHRFEVEIDEGLKLTGPEAALHSIFQNLVTNAVRYTPVGGAVHVSWRETAEGARFAVEDTGIGVAPQDIPRLTERFYRVDVGRSRASGGTGLGLSIVKHALDAFDAQLDVDSEIGVGSTFACMFPPHRVIRDPVPGSTKDSLPTAH
ncbi:phosphate regulon sensor histidine kinase PhoR [Sinimarinibacterium sp. CAU 1509]|uniref:phosphate regulon sensor histidine kinase PhoR n=1 Tax=Sinimarinibacterium sp. CAU 1509 TaxID=2562283 RepID=UPI0010ABE729|nr:phosphate regulon sensor histidine kinase PhoR [Sinimarinibacterium sp. CAU 1509]TJY62135.1 phosphate regulon sensor histidine kinase PhoR [Sinimarinibacterium sp. CAU 1509]